MNQHANQHELASSRHVIVEGPIGAGKTTLTQRLYDQFGGTLMLEAPQENPFLESFYQDSERYALPTQLAFLFQRDRQLRRFDPQVKHPVLCDFMYEKDALFAELALTEAEYRLYQQTAAAVATPVPVPDLVIYLQAAPRYLIERIHKRNHAYESSISEAYLSELCEAYARFFYQYNAAPLLIVNCEHINPAENDADFALLLERIAQMRGRREYFNRAS